MSSQQNDEIKYTKKVNKIHDNVKKKIMNNIDRAYDRIEELSKNGETSSVIYDFTIYLQKWSFHGPTIDMATKMHAVDMLVEKLNNSGKYKQKIMVKRHYWEHTDILSLLFRLPHDKYTVQFEWYRNDCDRNDYDKGNYVRLSCV